MAQELLSIDTEYLETNHTAFLAFKESAEKLLSASEKDFESIKKEKWFTRLFDIVTFSRKNDIRLGSQIASMAQAQDLLIGILLRLSENDSRVSEIISDAHEKIRKLAEQNILLAKKIRQIDNVAIFGIPSPKIGIDNFNETDKNILSGVITFVSELFETPSSAQQNYANSLLRELNVDTIDLDNINLSLEKITDYNTKKVLFQCAMELVFLNENSFKNIDIMNSVIDLFDFGKKTTNEIVISIEKEFKIRGQAGISEKYGMFEQGFTTDEDLFFETGDNLSTIDIEIEKTVLRIENILKISSGETKTIKNKIVHFDGIIECAGSLIFENCNLIYRESNSVSQIDLANGSSVEILNCNIECRSTVDGKYFLNSNSNTVTIKIIDSTLNNCFKFIDSNSDESTILVSRSTISESLDFINGSASIVECKIINPQKNSFSSSDSKVIKLEECLISLYESKCDSVFSGFFDISFTTFLGKINEKDDHNQLFSSSGWWAHGETIIKNCIFKNINILSLTGNIRDSYFKACGSIISNDSEVSYCTFDACWEISNFTSYNTHFSHCTFRNIAIDSRPLFEFSSVKTSSIKKSFFDGVYLQSKTPMITSGWGDKKHYNAIIEECHFKNCYGGTNAKLVETMGKRDKTIGEQVKTFAKKGGAFALLGGPVGIAATVIGGVRTVRDNCGAETEVINVRECTGIETIIDLVPPAMAYNEVVETTSGIKIGCSFFDSTEKAS